MKNTKKIFIRFNSDICLNVLCISTCYYDSETKSYTLSAVLCDNAMKYTLSKEAYDKLVTFLKDNGLIGKKSSKFFVYGTHLMNVTQIYNIDHEHGKIEFRDTLYYNLGKTSKEFKAFLDFMKEHDYIS